MVADPWKGSMCNLAEGGLNAHSPGIEQVIGSII